MEKYLYIVIDRNKNDKHLSYHLKYKSAICEVCKLSNIPFTMKNFNKIGSSGGFKNESINYFILEEDIKHNDFEYEKEVTGFVESMKKLGVEVEIKEVKPSQIKLGRNIIEKDSSKQ